MAAPGFLDSISPWTSRSTTPKPSQSTAGDSSQLDLPNQQSKNHAIGRRQRLRPQDYPSDCPKSTIKWFYAVDASASPLHPLTLVTCDRFRKGSLRFLKNPH